MSLEQDRLEALRLLKKLQQELLDLEEKENALSSDTLTTEKEKLEIRKQLIKRGKELKKANKEISEMTSKHLQYQVDMEERINSISGQSSIIKDIEKQRIKSMNDMSNITDTDLEKYTKLSDLNFEISELNASQPAKLQQLQFEYESISSQLRGMESISHSQLDILEEQNKTATAYASLSEKQRSILSNQKAILEGINKTAQGVLETLKTLTSGPLGLLGSGLLGAGFLMKKLGHTAHETGTFFTEMSMSATGLSLVFGDAVNVAKSLSKELGGIENATFKTQLQANLLANNLNISGDEVTSLIGSFSRLNGNSTEVATSTLQAVKNLSKANNVIPAQVMADLAGSTEEFALYGKEGGSNLANAAVFAAKLGVSMSQISGVANNLLDFESSITKELELGAMLGRNINLNKARQLAYDGDIGAATKETLNQLGGINAFNQMDVFQKQQSAQLLGVSVAEMQKMVANMDKLNDDGTIQLTQTEMVGKKFDYISEVMKGIATGPGGDFLKMLGGGAIAMGQMGFDVKGILGNMLKWPISKVQGMFGKVSGGASSATESITEKVTSGGKQGVPGKSIMDGMSKINMNAVLKGAAAMVIVAGAVFVFGKAVQEFMKVSWESVGMAVVSMIALVGAVALLGAIMSSGVGAVAILAGAAAMIVVAGAMYILGMAIQEIATGFSALGMIGSTISDLVSMVGGIGLLSTAFMGLAGSLMFLGTAGLVALPALLGISMASKGLAVVADVLGIGGSSETTGGIEDGSLSEYQTQMLQKMDKLIQATMSTRDVYLDREKVTNVVMRTGERKTENVFGLGVA